MSNKMRVMIDSKGEYHMALHGVEIFAGLFLFWMTPFFVIINVIKTYGRKKINVTETAYLENKMRYTK